jgi:hypothetical protein
LGVLGLAAAGGFGLGVVLATGGQQPVGAVSSLGPSTAPPSNLGLAGSPPSSPSLVPSASPAPTPTPVPTPTTVPAPLTGRLVLPQVAARHPIAVMIDDLGAARPQSGFSAASVVWQAPAEGGIPRYMLVFQENIPKAVGPVRSSRQYYIAWASEWRALYVHAGGSPQALASLRANGRGQWVYNADEFRWGHYFHRIRQRNSPHNLYTDGANLRRLANAAGARDIKAPKASWKFAPAAPLERRPKGGLIQVSYPWNKITYRYDRASNTYLRSVTGEPKQIDASTGARVAPTNVVIMTMSFGPLNDGSHKHRLEANFIGKGLAWVSTNGRTIKGSWVKKSMTGPTRFYDRNGRQIALTVGQTFVQVMPKGSRILIADGKVPPTTATPSAAPGLPTPTPQPS